MTAPSLIIGVDRSQPDRRVEAYSLVAVRVECQELVLRYTDFFKHVRRMGSRAKRIYLLKMPAKLRELVDAGCIVLLWSTLNLDSLAEMLEHRKQLVLACVIDDVVLHYHTKSGLKMLRVLDGIPLLVTEKLLKKPNRTLLTQARGMGVLMPSLHVVNRISDNVAYYHAMKVKKLLNEATYEIPVVVKV